MKNYLESDQILKRFFDITLSAIALITLLPILLLLAITIFMKLGLPILFIQERAGLHGRIFRIIKFRTMKVNHDRGGSPTINTDRLCDFGKWLRSTSLDELPELLNVLKGEMSIVGPRPLLPEYVPLYNQHHKRRHDVLPGITGWAQVNGRNALSWPEKFDYDIWYVDNRSHFLDFQIIILTAKHVALRTNINAKNEITMPKFTGYDE